MTANLRLDRLPRTVELARAADGAATLAYVDQRLLPGKLAIERTADWGAVAEAIKTLTVRGAPAIGVAGAAAVAAGRIPRVDRAAPTQPMAGECPPQDDRADQPATGLPQPGRRRLAAGRPRPRGRMQCRHQRSTGRKLPIRESPAARLRAERPAVLSAAAARRCRRSRAHEVR
ncbi:putative methylthioribose-1-phosphate isomerase [bioreactor metagenome]|uniref:Putative methylthioribose-1-phosphate isomerase n=1 Tax=bioreactor metagenome TaxID=1076179 RepID=A0A645CX39_9ZZZZ